MALAPAALLAAHPVVLGAIDAPTATVVAAICAAFAALGVRLIPRTRSEAAVDRAAAKLDDAQRWGELVDRLRLENADIRAEREIERTERIRLEAVVDRQRDALEAVRHELAAQRRRYGPDAERG